MISGDAINHIEDRSQPPEPDNEPTGKDALRDDIEAQMNVIKGKLYGVRNVLSMLNRDELRDPQRVVVERTEKAVYDAINEWSELKVILRREELM